MANTKFDAVTNRDVSPDAQQARQTVVRFLTWYKNHMHEANQISLVNQAAGKPYSVNLKNGERYLRYLKSSQLLTDAYLNQWRTFFKERQAGFRQSPQSEGPPTGFDYDLVMLNQDVDMQFAALKSLKMGKVVISNNKATVGFTLLNTYEFRLVRQNGRWLINEILNQSQE
ncbi:hypothetical protein [Spirosoma luteum]|uniref:hypothetical protein n=1 Tax=Spirosoma luteum TaxID=431553 RepID=UPI00037AB0D8|nr:hypothetical protein [Spirosoma luteum]